MQKSADAFRTISEVADDLSLPQHVLRFWETRFPQIRPLKRAGGRRYYRPADVLLLKTIRQLLYDDGYTIKGVQRLLKEQGAKGLSAGVPPADLHWTEETVADKESTGRGPSSDIGPEKGLVQNAQSRDSWSQASHIQDRPDTRAYGQRDAIEAALATIDDCKRILDALLRPSR